MSESLVNLHEVFIMLSVLNESCLRVLVRQPRCFFFFPPLWLLRIHLGAEHCQVCSVEYVSTLQLWVSDQSLQLVAAAIDLLASCFRGTLHKGELGEESVATIVWSASYPKSKGITTPTEKSVVLGFLPRDGPGMCSDSVSDVSAPGSLVMILSWRVGLHRKSGPSHESNSGVV